MTIAAVRMKNKLQSPCKLSTTTPLLEATNVLPATLSEAISAYCVALKALLHRSDIKATIATVLHAPVKPSTMTVTASKEVEGPVCAMSAKSRFDAAIATPAVMSPRYMP